MSSSKSVEVQYLLHLQNLSDFPEKMRKMRMEVWFLETLMRQIPSIPSRELFQQKLSEILEEYSSIKGDVYQMYCNVMFLTRCQEKFNETGPVPYYLLPGIQIRLMNFKPKLEEVYGLHLNITYIPSCWLYQPDYIAIFMNDLLEILEDLFRSKDPRIVPVMKQLEDLEQTIQLMRNLLKYVEKRSKSAVELQGLTIHFRASIDKAAFLCYSCLVEKMDESVAREMNTKLSDLLQNMKPFNPEVQQDYIRAFQSLDPSDSPWKYQLEVVSLIDFLLLDMNDQLSSPSSFLAPVQDQIENLQEEIIFLKAIVLDPPKILKTEKFNYLMRKVDEVIIQVGPTIYSISAENTEGNSQEQSPLSDFLESIKLVKADFRKVNSYCFPSTDELRSIDFFLENLDEFLIHRTDSIVSMKHQFGTIHVDLLYLRSFLDKINELRDEHEELKDLWQRATVVAFWADLVINSIMVGDGPACCHMLQLLGIVEEIKVIKTEVIEIYGKKGYGSNFNNIAKASVQASSQRTTPNIDEVVGFEDEALALTERLIGISNHREVVAIVGMPGLGKTTLAKKLYNNPSIEQQFHVRAWCCVSQTYQRRNLLLETLGNIVELTNIIYKLGDEELAEFLYKCLKGQRYIVVLDDMWDTGAWNALKRCFPDDKNQSRILITSRMHEVAEQIMPRKNVHSLRLFHDEESWMLLERTLFRGESCPEELSEAGKQICKNCKGLPLAVALAAGMLSKMDQKESQWKQFGKSLSERIVSDSNNQFTAILELSYNHLPNHLKSRFLYFGAFPEDHQISAKKLIRLWIAEGFIQSIESKRLEDVAENYLMELIGRSLVTGSKSTYMEGIKACHIHDLLRDFCLVKAEEENFLHRVSSYDKLFPPPTDGFIDYGVDSDYSSSSTPITYEQYRLSIYSKRKHFIMAMPSGPNVRSLLLHVDGDKYPNYPYDASFISHSFMLLRVLDLWCINIGDSFKGIELLVHLRYLALRGDIEYIPSSIANLWSLETFLFKGLRVEIVRVSSSIWNMVKLRHLHINDPASFDVNHHMVENSSLLDNFVSFSTPSLAYGDDVEKLLRRLKNLRKLRCIFLDSWDYFKQRNRFPMLEFLSQLISLKVSCNYKLSHSIRRYPCEFHFPSNLRKLTLSDFCLPWSEISSIGSLPNLEVLKLLCRAFEGKTWDMEEGQFQRLKHLKLESLGIAEWNATADHIPLLESLVLRKCKKLMEIPPSFGDINTLEMIQVQWCSRSSAISARNILEEQKEYGNESLKVHIYPKEKDS